jgi:hypothetical protein
MLRLGSNCHLGARRHTDLCYKKMPRGVGQVAELSYRTSIVEKIGIGCPSKSFPIRPEVEGLARANAAELRKLR